MKLEYEEIEDGFEVEQLADEAGLPVESRIKPRTVEGIDVVANKQKAERFQRKPIPVRNAG